MHVLGMVVTSFLFTIYKCSRLKIVGSQVWKSKVLETSSRFMLLGYLDRSSCLAKLVNSVLNNFRQYDMGYEGAHLEKKDKMMDINITHFLRKVANGHLIMVMKVLRSSKFSLIMLF